jgi:hypothetical protein
VLVLGLSQELFAWLPRSGRYRQLTTDDGRVLAALRSEDGRTVVYVRGSKLVRSGGAAPHLRGLSLRRLEVARMALGPPVELPGDVAELSLWPASGATAELAVTAPGGPPRFYRLKGDLLEAVAAPSPETRRRPPVRLTGRGVTDPGRLDRPAPCAFRAADDFSGNHPPRVQITAGKKTLILAAPLGAGLYGLPFPQK